MAKVRRDSVDGCVHRDTLEKHRQAPPFFLPLCFIFFSSFLSLIFGREAIFILLGPCPTPPIQQLALSDGSSSSRVTHV